MASMRLGVEHAWSPSDSFGARGAPDAERGSRRDRLVDAAFFAFALLGGAALYSNQVRIEDMPGWRQAAGLAAGLAACGLLWTRRRHPVGVALAILPCAVLSSFAAPAGLVAFFTVAVHRRLALVLLIGALALSALSVAYAMAAARRPELQTSYWLSLLSIVLLHVAIAALGMFVRARRLLLGSLRERAERAEAEQRLHAERAREQERARIAREMHDVLAHRISLLSMHAGSLEFRPDASPEQVARAAGVIRESAHQALEDLREVIGVLRETSADDAPARPQPTLTELPALLDESRRAGMTVRSELAVEDPDTAPAGVGRSAYRVVQEGLTNARKHAGGVVVDLRVAGRARAGLEIELRNASPVGTDGPAMPGAGAGLIGLAERVSLAGGRLEHGADASGGFRLWAWLPWP